MKLTKQENRGRLALLGTTLIWGSTFVIIKSALDDITPTWLLAMRFFGAAVLISLFVFGKLKSLDRGYIKGGTVMGTVLAAAYIFQTYGLYYTTPGKNAFLTAVYCILVPFLYWLIFKRKPDKYNVIAAMLGLVGMGFVCLQNDLTVNTGDVLTIFCGMFFAVHIIVTAHFVEDRDPVLLNVVQFAAAAMECLAFALIFEPAPHAMPTSSLFAIIYLSVVCTGLCYILQTFGQKYTQPSAAALILTLESVFGTVLSVMLGREDLTAGVLCGFVLIFIAIVISETKLGFLKK